MIYFTAHTFKCVCHYRRVMFRVLGMYNFGGRYNILKKNLDFFAHENMKKPRSKVAHNFPTYIRHIVSTFSSLKDSKFIHSRCVVQNYRLLSRYADKLEVRIIMIKNRCL